MYTPDHFDQSDPATLFDWIDAYPFGLLVVTGASGLEATHLPFMLDRTRGPHGALRCHVARANPIWRALEEGGGMLAVFSGPHAYISPDWYASPNLVPTWNYVAVHASGRARVMNDEELHRLLQDLSRFNEEALRPKPPWTLADMPKPLYANMRKAIVGIDIEISRLQGKWKMSQNRAPADREGAVRGLRERGGEQDLAVADLIEAANAAAKT